MGEENDRLPDLTGGVDTLLDHRAKRLEDIANNSIDLIRINLLLLGLFTPIISTLASGNRGAGNTLLQGGSLFGNNLISIGVMAWGLSVLIATWVYRRARNSSVSQFDALENAFAERYSESTLHQELVDGNKEYQKQTDRLTALMSASIGFSFVAILGLSVAISSQFFGLEIGTKFSTYLIMLFGFFLIIGRDSLEMIGNFFPTFSEEASVTISASPLGKTSFEYEERIQDSDGMPKEVEGKISFDILSGFKIEKSVSDIPPIRSRLVVAIAETFGSDEFTISQLQRALEDTNIPVTRTFVKRLVEDGLLEERRPDGPETFIINEKTGEFLMGNDNLAEYVDDYISNFIAHMEGEEKSTDEATLRRIASKVLEVEPENVEKAMTDGDTTDRMNKLDDVVGAVKSSGEVEKRDDYDQIGFRRSANRYKLSNDLTHLAEA